MPHLIDHFEPKSKRDYGRSKIWKDRIEFL